MFDYPIAIPDGTLYDDYGVGPESTAQEIADARADLFRAMDVEIRGAQERLDLAFGRIAGLKEAYEAVDRLDEPTSQVLPDAAARAREALAELEQRAEAIEPDVRRLRERIRELKRREEDLNSIDLQNAEVRLDYDRARPPLELLELARDLGNPFAASEDLDLEPRDVPALLRRELTAFLIEQGEPVFHPSDLTRDDYSRDFTYQPLLDDPES